MSFQLLRKISSPQLDLTIYYRQSLTISCHRIGKTNKLGTRGHQHES